MLEFYYKYHLKQFPIKSKLLAEELLHIFKSENIQLLCTDSDNISTEYSVLIDKELYILLNNLYFTIRTTQLNHPLLKKYLPELKTESNKNFQFADLFCGAGGLSQGLLNAGFNHAFVNDNSIDALETYYFNHNLHLSRFYCGDIRDLISDFENYKHYFNHIKLIAGGPPCQGFSNANRWNFVKDQNSEKKRFIDDDRNILYKYYVKLLGMIKPDFFIMENVIGMMREEKEIEEDIKNETKEEYHFLPVIVDAQNFNIPQRRKRYILIGGKEINFIKEVNRYLYNLKNKPSKYKLKDALFGLPEIKTNPYKLKTEYNSDEHGHTIRKYKLKQNDFLKVINKNKEVSFLLNHKSRYNNNNDLEIYRELPEGGDSMHPNIRHLNNYQNRNDIFKDKYYKLKNDDVSKTITSHMKYDCHMYIHPKQARGLSPRESARLQTFPDDYLFRGTLNNWYKQIGNAVPVKLAEYIANKIMEYYK